MTNFYNLHAFIAVCILSLIHIFAGRAQFIGNIWHTRFLSMAGGVAVAYVFVELMPRLGFSQTTLQAISADIVPLKERHVYIVAFLGFLFFYGISHVSTNEIEREGSITFWLNMASYVFLNFLVGYEIVDMNDPFIQPLYLFTFALGLHYFITDYSLREKHLGIYDRIGRFILAIALFLGFIAGLLTELPKSSVIYGVAFVAGGVILNVLSHELPTEDKKTSFAGFAIGGILYSIVLVYQG
jgi:hypothetical protein